MTVRCLRCGKLLETPSQFCDDCRPALSAQQLLRDRATFGEPMVCPSCGVVTSPDNDFCHNCGYGLAVPETFAPGTMRYAGFWVRLVAWVIDGVFLLVPSLLFRVVFADDQALIIAASLALNFVYQVGFWTAMGATPGKMLLGLSIVQEDGSAIGVGKAFVRYLGQFLSALLIGIGFLLIAFGEKKRALHDSIAGTVVVFADTLPHMGDSHPADF